MKLVILPAPLEFIGVSVAVYLIVSFTVHLYIVSYQQRAIRRLQTLDSQPLMQQLFDYPEVITGILLSRGLARKELADRALFLLLSSSVDERWGGWLTLGAHFPDIKEQLIALDPDIKEKLVGIAFPQGPPDTVPKLVESLRKTICD